MNGDLDAFNRAMLWVMDDTSDVAEDRGDREEDVRDDAVGREGEEKPEAGERTAK